MAVNITEIRETIGEDDKPIAVCAMQGINIIEMRKRELEVGEAKRRDANSEDLSLGMIIAVYTGNNPNKQQEVGTSR